MEYEIEVYKKEIELNWATKGLLITGKATLSIKETHEPSSMFHGDFWDYECLDVEYKDLKAEVEETGEPVTEIPADILEDFTYGYKEKVKLQDRKYI